MSTQKAKLGDERVVGGVVYRVVRLSDKVVPCAVCAARCVGDGLTPRITHDDRQTRAGRVGKGVFYVCSSHDLRCTGAGARDNVMPFVAVDDIPRLTLKGYLA